MLVTLDLHNQQIDHAVYSRGSEQTYRTNEHCARQYPSRSCEIYDG